MFSTRSIHGDPPEVFTVRMGLFCLQGMSGNRNQEAPRTPGSQRHRSLKSSPGSLLPTQSWRPLSLHDRLTSMIHRTVHMLMSPTPSSCHTSFLSNDLLEMAPLGWSIGPSNPSPPPAPLWGCPAQSTALPSTGGLNSSCMSSATHPTPSPTPN